MTCACGKTSRPGGTECYGCAMRRYRSTVSGRATTRAANKRWARSEKGRRYRRGLNKRNNQIVPEGLHELRRALSVLEEALAEAEERP